MPDRITAEERRLIDAALAEGRVSRPPPGYREIPLDQVTPLTSDYTRHHKTGIQTINTGKSDLKAANKTKTQRLLDKGLAPMDVALRLNLSLQTIKTYIKELNRNAR